MGKQERRFNEELLHEYKDTNDEKLFEKIINDKDIKNYINYIAWQKAKNCPTTLYSQEDFVSISYLVLWQRIHMYRFICPECGLQAKTPSAYKLHTTTKHGKLLDPAVSISRYLKFNLGSYLQNQVRSEYSLDRKTNVLTINIFSPDDPKSSEDDFRTDNDEFDIVSEFSLENEIVFKDVVLELTKQFDAITKEVFNYIYDGKMKQREIAELFYNQGRYSSVQSAAVVISRIVKNKINPIVAALYPEIEYS